MNQYAAYYMGTWASGRTLQEAYENCAYRYSRGDVYNYPKKSEVCFYEHITVKEQLMKQ